MSLHGVNFSKMDVTITIETPVETVSTSGESQQPSWTTLKTVKAERRRKTGSEDQLDSQSVGKNPVDYVIRYDSLRPVDFKMRVYEGDPAIAPAATYGYINDVQNNPRERFTLISINRWDNG